MNAGWPEAVGNGTKRGTTELGMCTTESVARGSAEGAVGRRATTRHAVRLGRYGNGWPGSMASGVTTGARVRRNYSSRNVSCSVVSSLAATARIAGEVDRVGT